MSGKIYYAFVFTLLMADTRCQEMESCAQSQLDDCVAALPGGQHRGHTLPLTLPHIQELCRNYRIGMDCVEAWTQRCLPTETKVISDRQTLGARQMMKFLCHDATFRREYLNHTACFRAVSADWQRCMAQLSSTARAVAERSRSVLYVDPRSDICCAREEFQECVARSGRAKCTRAGAVLLRRIAETLAADEGRCAACRAATPRSASAVAICLLAAAAIRRAG